MSTATLSGHTCMSARVHLPAWGLPWCEVELDREVTFSGACSLVVADLTVACCVVSGGPWMGRSAYRLVGGAGGWQQSLPPKSYTNDAGVKLSKVISDAAASAGEQVAGLPAGACGPAFDRLAGPASQVLQLLAPRAWRVDADGVTRFGAPPATEPSVTAARGKVDFAAGYVELMADSISSIVPGIVVEGLSAVDVIHTLETGKLRTTLWGSAAAASKRLAAYEAIVSQLFPQLRYGGSWEYRVVSVDGGRLTLQPARASLPVPDLTAVKIRPGVPGLRGKPSLGSLCHVEFLNSDPARPVVVSFDDSESAAFSAQEIAMCAGSTGSAPTEHAISAESVVGLIALVLYTIGQANQGSLTGIAIAGPPGTPTISAPLAVWLNAAIAAMAIPGVAGVPPISGDISPYVSAINAALALKIPDVAGTLPNMGWPNVRGA